MKHAPPFAGAPATLTGGPAAAGGGTAPGVAWLVAAGLAVLVAVVYWGIGGHGFVVIDDGLYVTENRVVLRGLTWDGVRWAFSTFHAGNWHPLTWLSHMVDVELFGPSPGWHHRVNVLYHLLNTELLFFVLWRMTGGLWPGAFVAALFGVHPLHVESVAWVAERKDVLSTLFLLLAMGAYLRYVRRPGVGRYAAVAGAFALGLLCKPMVVTLPFLLLLLDAWPLGRLEEAGARRLVLEKVPLLVLSAASGAVTYAAQATGKALFPLAHLSAGERLSNALVSYAVYLEKAAWPSSLAVFYPHPGTIGASVPAWEIAASGAAVAGLFALAAWQRHRRPYLAVGWLWYVGTLVPVIGLVQVGAQAHADRYTYVPLIGIFIAAAWGVPSLFPPGRARRLGAGVLAVVSVAALAAAARVQAGYWRDGVTLFTRATAVTEKNWLAWNNLGTSYDELGRDMQAIDCYREALRIKPDSAETRFNLGVSCARLGRDDQAIGHFREAVRIRPAYPEAWCNMGVSWARLGDIGQAVACFREALRIDPGFDKARIGLAAVTGGAVRSPVGGTGLPAR